MTRERARTERRDLDKERGEPVAGGAARGGPRALRPSAKPLHDWSTRPRILITNDDGVESRGLLALKQALDPIGDTTVVAPDTNQSAVGHQKTLMRPLRVRERTLADGSLAYSVDGSPTDAVSISFLGYFGHGFDLVASGINYGANLGDDITYSGHGQRGDGGGDQRLPRVRDLAGVLRAPRLRPSPAGAATTVARNILEHGLSRGELVNVNVPAVQPEEFERLRGHPARPAGLPGPADRAGRPARNPLLLDRRAAAVRPRRRGHRLPRRRQPPDRDHADPSRPDRPAAPQAAADVELAARDMAPREADAVPPATSRTAADADERALAADDATSACVKRPTRHG